MPLTRNIIAIYAFIVRLTAAKARLRTISGIVSTRSEIGQQTKRKIQESLYRPYLGEHPQLQGMLGLHKCLF